MFEQESYDKATIQVASQPGDIFRNYEIRSWEFSPLIYKILAVSAVLHIAMLAFIAQTNVLTMRGCDSPWVGRVCQVVDMTYVSALLFGTPREYADVAYERTELSPEDEITYIIVSGDKLEYPEGYFQLANPEQFTMASNNDLGFPSSSYIPPVSAIPNNDSDLLKIRPNPPIADPNAFKDDPSMPLITTEDGAGGSTNTMPRNAGTRKRSLNNNSASKEPSSTAVADANANKPQIPQTVPSPEDEAKPDKFGVFINKRPMKDRAKETVARVEEKKLQLDKPFKVIIEGTLGLGKDGKTTVLKNPKALPVDPNVPNDPEMVKLAQDWILAVGDAGWYAYLDRLDDKTKVKSGKVVITIEQNDTEFLANIRSEKASENAAKSIASGLGLLLQAAAAATSGDEQTFLKAAAPPTSDGKNLVLNFRFDKPLVQELIQRKLAEAKTPPAEPNSTALNSAASNTASK